jgi:hypothetical protein
MISSTSGMKGKFFNINTYLPLLSPVSTPVLSLNTYQPAFTVCVLNLLNAFLLFVPPFYLKYYHNYLTRRRENEGDVEQKDCKFSNELR